MTASTPSDPATFLGDGQVFDAELDEIGRRRAVLTPGAAANEHWEGLTEAERTVLKQDLFGLALSGGGIRSATFALGVLQAMHACGALRVFDYLSTVSGGGFVGGWWSAWLSRQPPRPTPFPPEENIEPARAVRYLARTADGSQLGESSLSAGSDPIHHLRLFSNYLTPRKGMLSGDFWRAMALVSRNLVTMWLVLIPVLLAAVLAGQLYFAFQPGAEQTFFQPVRPTPIAATPPRPGAAVASSEEAAAYAAKYRVYASERQDFEAKRGEYRRVLWERIKFAGWPVLGIYVMGLVMGTAWFFTLERERGRLWLAFVMVALGAILACALWAFYGGAALASAAHGLVESRGRSVAVALFVLFALWRVWKTTRTGQATDQARVELQRNWLVAEQAMWLLALVMSAALLAVAGFGHDIVALLKDWTVSHVASAGGWLAALGAVAGAAFTAFKAAPAGGHDSNAMARPGMISRLVFAISPTLFIAVLAVTCAWASHALLSQMRRRDDWLNPLVVALCIGIGVATVLATIELWEGHRKRAAWLLGGVVVAVVGHTVFLWVGRSHRLAHLVSAVLALALVWVVTLGWTIDPNALSLHTFYKMRIVRAYLGASNPLRGAAGQHAEVTDAVPGDDVLLKDLMNTHRGAPFHLVNTTVNLVGGHDLATAQRTAAAFTLTPVACGSTRTGYRPTSEYLGGTLTLGTAVAISGAAASPNMGAVTPSAALAMLMTLFNVRLGYWAPTPNRPSWREPQARLWPYYVLREFLSQTNDTSTYCYLTDGGHFDNTGLYALVERGCRFIVIVDDGTDPEPCFEDVGEAIRRCKIDFGAEICLDVAGFQRSDGFRLRLGERAQWEGSMLQRLERKSAGSHFTVGTIQYSAAHAALLGWADQTEAGRRGLVVWIKPSLAGDEPADVRQYALQNADFPQQTTLEQWFGESQFESYRRLGEFTGRQVFADVCGLELAELRAGLKATKPDGRCQTPAAPATDPAG